MPLTEQATNFVLRTEEQILLELLEWEISAEAGSKGCGCFQCKSEYGRARAAVNRELHRQNSTESDPETIPEKRAMLMLPARTGATSHSADEAWE